MLEQLTIKNIVLIENLSVSFAHGMSVLTGETGAGKSILLDGLSLALGERADVGLIRYGEESASVSAVFSVDKASEELKSILAEAGIPFSSELVLRRTLSTDGKSKAFINDEAVSINLLKSVGENLVEIHGQFANHSLLNNSFHLEALDDFAEISADKTKVSEAFLNFKNLKKEKAKLEKELEGALRDKEFLEYSLTELKNLAPLENEESELASQRTVLQQSEKINQRLSAVFELLNKNTSLEDSVVQIQNQLEKIALDNANLEAAKASFEQAIEQLAEGTNAVSKFAASLNPAGTDLQTLEDRLFALRDLGRKHQVSPNELPALIKKFEEKLSTISVGSDNISKLSKEIEKASAEFLKLARELSQKRKGAAKKLDALIMKELPALKLEKARFVTEISELAPENYGEQGIDAVVFMVSTNAGTPLSFINKIASGGELARLMLAIKVVMSETFNVPTMVFDEIDSAIGGATAAAVGERLAKLAEHLQVLVITHSPQVAAKGNSHYKIIKLAKENGKTNTILNHLNENERREEIARMISADKITDEARLAADKLLNN